MLSHSRKEKWHGLGSQEGGVYSILEHETFNKRNSAGNLSHEMRAEWMVWSVNMPIKVRWLLF